MSGAEQQQQQKPTTTTTGIVCRGRLLNCELSVVFRCFFYEMIFNDLQVHAAIENVGLKEVWLKIAGGEKAGKRCKVAWRTN